MPESKAVVGLSWEPKLPNLSAATSSASGSNTKAQENQSESKLLWKSSADLVDGLFVPPNNPRKLNKLLKKQVKDTTGKSWYVLFLLTNVVWLCLLFSKVLVSFIS